MARVPSRALRCIGHQGIDAGLVTAIEVEAGATVDAGDTVVVLEAMKLVFTLQAKGRAVRTIRCKVGATVATGDLLVEMEPVETTAHREGDDMAGLYFEEFTPGQVFEHAWTRTVTEMDNMLFSMLTMNPQPLHIDAISPQAPSSAVRWSTACSHWD